MLKRASALLCLMGLTACGHQFNARADTNLAPDPYFTDRDFIKYGVAENGDRIDDWVGKIATWNGNAYVFYPVPYLKGSRPIVVAEQKNYSYHATIDKNWRFSGIFPFVQVDATGNTAFEIQMVDTANVAVAPQDEVLRGPTFDKEAKDRGIADPSKVGLYWVKGVALQVLTKKTGTKVGANATINGDGFGASGGADYDATEAQSVPMVSVEVLPMNSIADEEVKERQKAHAEAKEAYAKTVAATQSAGQRTVAAAPARVLRVSPSLKRDPQTGLVPYQLLGK